MKKKKIEWSKLVCGIILAYGMGNGVMYHVEVLNGFTPDSALAVQSVVTILGSFLSYLIYNMKLKCSRNKYHVDENGVPFGVAEDANETPIDMQNMEDV